MYSATLLYAVENKDNPDQISVTVEYSNSDKTFSRQYDWISNTVNEKTIDLTIKDELIKMNIDTLTILEIMQPRIGDKHSLVIASDKTVTVKIEKVAPIKTG